MTGYTNIFNLAADRRQKKQPFAGPERRVLFEEKMRILEEERKMQDFLTRLHMIPDISRVSKNVNGNV